MGILDRILLVSELQSVRARLAEAPQRSEWLRRARARAHLAARTLSKPGPVDDVSAAEVTLDLCGQATHLALAAASGHLCTTREEQWAEADEELLSLAARPHPQARYRELLTERDELVLEDAETGEGRAMLRARANEALFFVERLVMRAHPEQLRLERFYVRRAVQGVLTILTLAAVLVGMVLLLTRVSESVEDLAKGKPWRASSSLGNCPLGDSKLCQGQSVDIFFHTEKQGEPWVEVDLGASLPFRSVELVNRSDCCSRRASPLRVEVSDDQKTWQVVARQEKDFRKVRLAVGAVRARFVRLKVMKTTAFHLERISIFP